ncbi:class I SAM-dependent methyltransferase [Actinoplanes aureus]|uniref:Methyltransferase domain-containing protein n=1 Tax=Actinoplanes aureus TaxID=2792083 RepID=A0A931C594_9ACTN|nr:methyltransferase domain-containing protein [Actinoplanes aureus]MBG0560381.1 methyltransferase domain-containing protein [Actinoplanes aureus]
MVRTVWESGNAYEAYVGRWSRRVAEAFVSWLDVPPDRRWLDVGCGTGALSARIAGTAQPARLVGVDRSTGFLASARAGGLRCCAGDAAALPLAGGGFDAVVSGLALNFVNRPEVAVREFARVAAPGGVVAAYVWDYAGGMEMMGHFWSAAAELDPAAAELAESLRFDLCRDDALTELWSAAGLHAVSTHRIVIPTVFADFDDYWEPFLGGQGPAPGYVATRTGPDREALRELLRCRLPARTDGSIALTAAAWAVRGTR